MAEARTSIEVNSFYTLYAIHQFDKIHQDFVETMKRKRYDTLVGTGLSGALVVPHLARLLDKNFLIIRKTSENSHANSRAEGVLGQRWIFVDDFISEGETHRTVKQAVRSIAKRKRFETKYVGAYLYRDNDFRKA